MNWRRSTEDPEFIQVTMSQQEVSVLLAACVERSLRRRGEGEELLPGDERLLHDLSGERGARLTLDTDPSQPIVDLLRAYAGDTAVVASTEATHSSLSGFVDLARERRDKGEQALGLMEELEAAIGAAGSNLHEDIEKFLGEQAS